MSGGGIVKRGNLRQMLERLLPQHSEQRRSSAMEATVIIYKRPSRRALNTGAAEMPLNDRGEVPTPRGNTVDGAVRTSAEGRHRNAGKFTDANLRWFQRLQRHGTTISAMQKD